MTAAFDPLYLCIDQGGHASRALVFDARDAVQASAVCEIKTHSARADWVEHDPEELVSSLQTVMAQALAALGDRAQHVVSAGLATQRSSIVCWDRHTGAALSPVISWQDRRAWAWLGQFANQAEEIQQRTGLRLSAHYGASKMRWCLDHLPVVTAAHREQRLTVGPLASFLAFRLLDEKPLLIDSANAARTLLYSLRDQDWDAYLLRLFGIPVEILPACVPTRHSFGTLHVAQQRIPLNILTGDQSAALFALGEPLANAAYINIGTGAFIQRVFERETQATGLLTGVVYRDAACSVYVLEGTVNGAGAALKWAQQEWHLQNMEAQMAQWLERESELPIFLNGVSGLGAPFWLAQFASRLIGAGEPWQKIIAVAESILFLLQTNLAIMQKFSPKLTRIFVSGGVAQYDGLCQRLADLSALSVYRPAQHEATARGIAYLLADFPRDWPELARGMEFKPRANPTLTARYQCWRQAMAI